MSCSNVTQKHQNTQYFKKSNNYTPHSHENLQLQMMVLISDKVMKSSDTIETQNTEHANCTSIPHYVHFLHKSL